MNYLYLDLRRHMPWIALQDEVWLEDTVRKRMIGELFCSKRRQEQGAFSGQFSASRELYLEIVLVNCQSIFKSGCYFFLLEWNLFSSPIKDEKDFRFWTRCFEIMKILHSTNHLDHGGISSFVYTLAHEMKRQGSGWVALSEVITPINLFIYECFFVNL